MTNQSTAMKAAVMQGGSLIPIDPRKGPEMGKDGHEVYATYDSEKEFGKFLSGALTSMMQVSFADCGFPLKAKLKSYKQDGGDLVKYHFKVDLGHVNVEGTWITAPIEKDGFQYWDMQGAAMFTGGIRGEIAIRLKERMALAMAAPAGATIH